MAIDDRRRSTRHALHVAAWRGDEHVAVLSPRPEQPTPAASTVAAEVHRLRASGVRRLLTSALHRGELDPFRSNGFVEHERLLLLRHDLVDLAHPAAPVRIRRARGRDQRAVLDIDARAFDEFWALDERGLTDAIRATPASRYRVVRGRGERLSGYAVTGRASDRGYLQRLAVDPARQRSGIGRSLVTDSLTWLRRSGARAAMVNTQEHNHRALALYRACGFVEEPDGLTVMILELT